MAYLEIASRTSHRTRLQLRVLHPQSSSWTAPVTVRTFDYGKGSQDYFTLVAANGVAHIVYSRNLPTGGSDVEYVAVRYH